MITIGVIGLGYWGPNILRILTAENNVNVKYICDINENTLVTYKDKFICTTNYQDILKDEDISMVFIVTPISTHFKIILDCINANKHVFVEKPLCKTLDEMKIIYKKCQENNVKLFCDYIFFYATKIQNLRRIVSENINDILYIEINRETFGIFSQDNVIYDLLPHDISILKLLFNDDFEINIKHVDKVYHGTLLIKAIISFEINTINGILNISWLNDTKERKIKFFCKTKIIEYNDIYDNIKIFNYHLKVNNAVIEQTKLISEDIVNINKEEPLRTSITTAINMVETNNHIIFKENANISKYIIECFEKIV
jgi:predicted dehydrogenase